MLINVAFWQILNLRQNFNIKKILVFKNKKIKQKNNRYSSVLVSWVKWKNSVMNVWARLCPGCKPGLAVTWLARASRNCKNNVLPSRLSNATCANTCNCVPGPGTNCGKRSSLCSMYPVLKMKLL